MLVVSSSALLEESRPVGVYFPGECCRFADFPFECMFDRAADVRLQRFSEYNHRGCRAPMAWTTRHKTSWRAGFCSSPQQRFSLSPSLRRLLLFSGTRVVQPGGAPFVLSISLRLGTDETGPSVSRFGTVGLLINRKPRTPASPFSLLPRWMPVTPRLPPARALCLL